MQTRLRLRFPGTLALLALSAACTTTVNTVPPVVSPSAPAREYTLELPADLEIRSVDYSASLYSDIGGHPQMTIVSSTGGRAFVKVYAVHRRTGEQYLLLYEDIAARAQPVHIIRFHTAPALASGPGRGEIP